MAYQGSIKSFNPDKGFGFIIGPDGNDVFLHIKAVADGGVPQKGDIVTFDMEPSPSKPGQMSATNVTGGTGGGGTKGTGAQTGQCKSFSQKSGFGFIVSQDGTDIFLHIKAVVDGTVPQQGDTLTFDTKPSETKPGQMQAINVTGGTGWPQPGYGKSGGDAWGMKGGGWGMKGGGKGGPYGGWGGAGCGWGAPMMGGGYGGKGGGCAYGGGGKGGGGGGWGGGGWGGGGW